MLSSPRSFRSAVSVGLQICAAYTLVQQLVGFPAASLEVGHLRSGASAPSAAAGSCGPGYSCLLKAAAARSKSTGSGSLRRTIHANAAPSRTSSAPHPAGRFHCWKHSSGPGPMRPCAGNKAAKKSGLFGASAPSAYLEASKAHAGVHRGNRVAGQTRSGYSGAPSHRKLSGSTGGAIVFDYSATLPVNSGLFGADRNGTKNSPAFPGYPEQMRAASSNATASSPVKPHGREAEDSKHVVSASGNPTASATADAATASAASSSSTGVGGESDQAPSSSPTHYEDSSSTSVESADSQSDISPEDDDSDVDDD